MMVPVRWLTSRCSSIQLIGRLRGPNFIVGRCRTRYSGWEFTEPDKTGTPPVTFTKTRLTLETNTG